MEKLNEAIEALNNISRTQAMLAEAILKQKENDAVDAEARFALARAAENNSLANLNISKSILSDKAIIERLLEIIENHK